MFNLTDHRMITSKVWTDDPRLLKELNLTVWQTSKATNMP